MAGLMNQPNPKQIKLAGALGIPLTPGMTGSELARKIDAAPPSDGQLEMARSLGVTVGPDMTRGELKRLLMQTNIRVGMAALRTNPALQRGKHIAIKGEVYEITDVWKNPRRPSVSIRPAGGGAKKVVAASLLRDVTEVAWPPTEKRPRKKP